MLKPEAALVVGWLMLVNAACSGARNESIGHGSLGRDAAIDASTQPSVSEDLADGETTAPTDSSDSAAPEALGMGPGPDSIGADAGVDTLPADAGPGATPAQPAPDAAGAQTKADATAADDPLPVLDAALVAMDATDDDPSDGATPDDASLAADVRTGPAVALVCTPGSWADAAARGAGAGGPTMLPALSGCCPTLPSGASGVARTFAGQNVTLWTGTPAADQHGPLVLYWHGSNASGVEVVGELGAAQISAVTSLGGMIAVFETSTRTGSATGSGTWFTDDFKTADAVVACAMQQFDIDARRIFALGAGDGAVHTAWMSYARSGYLAAIASLSGGILTGFTPTSTPQDPTNVPPALVIHGARGSDVLVIDRAVVSAAYEADIAAKGGFSIDCNTGGGHLSGPPLVSPAIWQFFVDHPFKVSPRPYPPLPAVFPSYCQIGPRDADGGV